MLNLLSVGVQKYGVKLQDDQILQFERYLGMLVDWSERTNLVGDVNAEVVQRRHFLESVALGAVLREREILRPGTTVLDVGAGAGFPGAVLKIVWPSIQLTLIEATAKKTAFLTALVDALGFDATPVLTGRAESLAHDVALRERFDLVVARAVAPLPALLELTLPFARIGGRVVTPKGSRVAQEVAASVNALRVLGARVVVIPFDVPGPAQQLVAAIKERATPAEYPRRDGLPAKSPL